MKKLNRIGRLSSTNVVAVPRDRTRQFINREQLRLLEIVEAVRALRRQKASR
jgi:hypothetical protein